MSSSSVRALAAPSPGAADQLQTPRQVTQSAKSADQGGVVLLLHEAPDHHDPGRPAERPRRGPAKAVDDPVMDPSHPIRRRDPVRDGKAAVVFAHRDDVRRKRRQGTLGGGEQPALGRSDAFGEGPAVGGEQSGDTERSGGQPAERAGLRRVGRDQVRLELSQGGLEFPKRNQVAERANGSDE